MRAKSNFAILRPKWMNQRKELFRWTLNPLRCSRGLMRRLKMMNCHSKTYRSSQWLQFDLKQHIAQRQEQINAALERVLPPPDAPPEQLHEAMRYTVFAGGKRLRPMLVLDACHAVGGNEEIAVPAACAVELIHTYSLIHDDLPCMDDDDFRRGKPTCHRVFGEAVAVLCGDALLTLAFEVLAKEQLRTGVPPTIAVEVIRIFAEGAGHSGMVGGQVRDMEAQGCIMRGETLHPEQLYDMHHRKTGALITASVEAGAVLGGADKVQRDALIAYAREIGLAFQITDDLLDVEGTQEELG
ncbi:MAG TPA: polyprenyl synthetase family protein, partial [Armatimonadetes bacterium]|nr:polyprenyl synthetase family protein [Armatimonadota bacterium]